MGVLGLDDAQLGTNAGLLQGPKKKSSKKEKAKMTAEMAEKLQAEMEAQAKRSVLSEKLAKTSFS